MISSKLFKNSNIFKNLDSFGILGELFNNSEDIYYKIVGLLCFNFEGAKIESNFVKSKKYNDFLGLCSVLARNLTNFDPSKWKPNNLTDTYRRAFYR